ncbi:hypothetical protein QAD02_018978 [Eretmocerus hayati]|uniref:Uncharacterized protein n=1 Tax=Eretmocerus hayati TaxID=131215 RepID=A0ACC2PK45_9HYME|nr:hypothetical protein QAD02_018978 [Eretmocerus hayati]
MKSEKKLQQNLKLNATKNNFKEIPERTQLSPCEGKERSLDFPSSRLKCNPRLNTKIRSTDSLQGRKNKFTWCGSCKSNSKSNTKRTTSTSPLRRATRSSLSADSAIIATDSSSKISLNVSKYSPCASRLARQSSPRSLKSEGSVPSPESPLHVSTRATSPLQRRSTISPSSEFKSLSRSTEILSIDGINSSCKFHESTRATAPASAIELNLERDKRTSKYRSPPR